MGQKVLLYPFLIIVSKITIFYEYIEFREKLIFLSITA